MWLGRHLIKELVDVMLGVQEQIDPSNHLSKSMNFMILVLCNVLDHCRGRPRIAI